MVHDQELQRLGRSVHACIPWSVAFLCCTILSSIDGMAVDAKMIRGGYLSRQEVDVVLAVGNQVQAWGSVMICLVLSCFGPRYVATSGTCLAVFGNYLMATMRKPTFPAMVTLANGCMNLGTQCVFLASVSFSNLIPRRQGLLDGLMEAVLNSAGALTLPIINSPAISLHVYFNINMCLMVALLILVGCFYPDAPYIRGETHAAISWPCSRGLPRGCSRECAWKQVVEALHGARLWGFVFTFTWSTLIAAWVSSVIQDLDRNAGPIFVAWGSSLVMNMTVLTCPLIGLMLDAFGFVFLGIIQITSALVAVVFMLFRVPSIEWATLGVVNIVIASSYTGQFAYLQRNYSAESLPLLLMLTHSCQGLANFINYPFLTGILAGNSNYAVWILLFPCILLYLWPAMEWRWRGQDRPGSHQSRHKGPAIEVDQDRLA